MKLKFIFLLSFLILIFLLSVGIYYQHYKSSHNVGGGCIEYYQNIFVKLKNLDAEECNFTYTILKTQIKANKRKCFQIGPENDLVKVVNNIDLYIHKNSYDYYIIVDRSGCLNKIWAMTNNAIYGVYVDNNGDYFGEYNSLVSPMYYKVYNYSINSIYLENYTLSNLDLYN